MLGLIFVTYEEWYPIRERLLNQGFKLHRDDKSDRWDIWTPDLSKRLTGQEKDGYYLDISLLPYIT